MYLQLLKKNIDNFVLNKNSINVLLIRHGESISNQSGSLGGWTDSPLTIKGRQQAHNLLESLYLNKNNFNAIYSSDLSRAYDTAQISLGFPNQLNFIQKLKNLREINFGEHENAHFDSLPQKEKDLVNTIEYSAPNGESWKQVRKRVQECFYDNFKKEGNYLVYSHGGVMCSLTWELGIQDVLPNCSAIALQLKQNTKKQLIPYQVLFTWQYDENLILNFKNNTPGIVEL